MAVCFLSSVGRRPFQLGRLPFKLYCVRSRFALLSTAAEWRSTGNDCQNDDGDDDKNDSVTHIRMLEIRANKLEEQVRDLTIRYNKALADSDTVRRRTQKFVEDAKRFGIQSFCRDLVEVADMVEQTTQGDKTAELQSLAQSLTQIQSRLQDVFIKHGLEKMSAVGSVYDPYQHEIVCHTPADELEPGTVAIIKQDGYRLHGRTIRHAHVGIAVKKQES